MSAAPRPLLSTLKDGLLALQVRAHPQSRGGDAMRVADGVLQVHTSAPARDGEANAAVEKAVAALLGVPRSSVSVVRGATDRDKGVGVKGCSAADAQKRIDALA
jgi:hypothetical protein